MPTNARSSTSWRSSTASTATAAATIPALEARIQTFELAYRMQMEATDAFDISKEPRHLREAYGSGVHGRQTLIARRLLERGVRYIQLWHGAGQPWDNHNDIEKNHKKLANELDGPAGALLTDLKQRGMLDDTLVIFGGEFGPHSDGRVEPGRQVHPWARPQPLRILDVARWRRYQRRHHPRFDG